MCGMVQKAYKDHLAGNRDGDVKVKHFGAAEDLGLIQTDSENSQCTFNWKALADLPWADASALRCCCSDCPTPVRTLLRNCGCSQIAGRNLSISTPYP